MDARYFALQLQSARRKFNQTGDRTAYLIDCLYVAARIGADALAREDRRFAVLGQSLSVASPAFKGLFATIADRLDCPVDAGHSHEDFLREVSLHARHYVDRDYPVVGQIMDRLGL